MGSEVTSDPRSLPARSQATCKTCRAMLRAPPWGTARLFLTHALGGKHIYVSLLVLFNRTQPSISMMTACGIGLQFLLQNFRIPILFVSEVVAQTSFALSPVDCHIFWRHCSARMLAQVGEMIVKRSWSLGQEPSEEERACATYTRLWNFQ